MNLTRRVFTTLCATALVASPTAFAQDCDTCDGDPGFLLTIPAEVGAGEFFDMYLEATPLSFIYLAGSLGDGPLNTPWGCFCLDFPFISEHTFIMPASGNIHLPHTMPCDQSLLGWPIHTQFFSFYPNGPHGRSNAQTIQVQDGDCLDACPDGKPVLLNMQYTGLDCAASRHAQDPGMVFCDGDPAFEPQVHIIASDKSLSDANVTIWFDGIVNLGETFDIDAIAAGATRLKGDTWIYAFDLAGNQLQSVSFHTSCSEPLHLGNRFGAFELMGFVGEDG